jgi:hypothetical protein
MARPRLKAAVEHEQVWRRVRQQLHERIVVARGARDHQSCVLEQPPEPLCIDLAPVGDHHASTKSTLDPTH